MFPQRSDTQQDVFALNVTEISQPLPECFGAWTRNRRTRFLTEILSAEFSLLLRRTRTAKRKNMAQRARNVTFFFMSFEVSNVEPLLDDFVRPRQHVGGNRLLILDFRFWILDCSINGLLYPLWLEHSAESSNRFAWRLSD